MAWGDLSRGRLSEKQKDLYTRLAEPLAARDLAGTPPFAEFLKMHKTTFQTVQKIREWSGYREWHEKLKRRQVKVLGEEFKEFTMTTKGKLREMADEAPAILYKIMMDESEKAPARIAAATEILDRDGRFAKVSRQMQVKEGVDGAPMLPEDAALEMLDALNDHKKHQKSEKPN
jgi:hypothetical protein